MSKMAKADRSTSGGPSQKQFDNLIQWRANNPGTEIQYVVDNEHNWTELFARPQSDRVVLRDGVAIDTTLPDYRELDDLMEA